LFFLGGNCLKFTSLINGNPQQALADTRAGGPAMDETYARRIDIPIAQDPAQHYRTIRRQMAQPLRHLAWHMVSGGSSALLVTARNICWTSTSSKMLHRTILSAGFLFRTTKAFVEHDRYFLEEDDLEEDEEAYLYTFKSMGTADQDQKETLDQPTTSTFPFKTLGVSQHPHNC
jgi:hypothetical protein